VVPSKCLERREKFYPCFSLAGKPGKRIGENKNKRRCFQKCLREVKIRVLP